VVRLAAEVSFRDRILRGGRLRWPAVGVVRVQDAPPGTTPVPGSSAWCADQRRLLLSHNLSIQSDFADQRADQGLLTPGVRLVPETALVGPTMADLVLVVAASRPADWQDRVVWLPLTK